MITTSKCLDEPLYDPVGTEITVGAKVIYNFSGVLAPGIIREVTNKVLMTNSYSYFSGIILIELTETITVRSMIFTQGHISKIKSPDSVFVLR